MTAKTTFPYCRRFFINIELIAGKWPLKSVVPFKNKICVSPRKLMLHSHKALQAFSSSSYCAACCAGATTGATAPGAAGRGKIKSRYSTSKGRSTRLGCRVRCSSSSRRSPPFGIVIFLQSLGARNEPTRAIDLTLILATYNAGLQRGPKYEPARKGFIHPKPPYWCTEGIVSERISHNRKLG